MLGAGNDLPLNSWTHVVFTMSGGTGRIYFDGELVAPGRTSRWASTTSESVATPPPT